MNEESIMMGMWRREKVAELSLVARSSGMEEETNDHWGDCDTRNAVGYYVSTPTAYLLPRSHLAPAFLPFPSHAHSTSHRPLSAAAASDR